MIKLKQNTWGLVILLISGILIGCSSGNVAPATVAPTNTTEAAAAPTNTTEAATLPAESTAVPAEEATAIPEATVAPTNTMEAAPEVPAAPISFNQDIAPILNDRCLKCHGGEKTREGFEVNSYDQLMAGSDNGQMIVAGDSAKSDFVKLIKEGKMPKKETKLTDEQIRLISDWINAGALNN